MTLALLLARIEGLNTGGWAMMIGCIGSVCGLLIFCFYRILRAEQPDGKDGDV